MPGNGKDRPRTDADEPAFIRGSQFSARVGNHKNHNRTRNNLSALIQIKNKISAFHNMLKFHFSTANQIFLYPYPIKF
ncbi:MAG: hypothetical protein DRI57_20895 [Deltaproteobacteria bacterium]|nr:MAG: hypothetical protein DRI57_20895 [Deltaproteobacteria bacterium]